MNILWLAPIPLIDNKETHPAPWIMTLANALQNEGHELTIVNNNNSIKNKILKTRWNNINLVYLKTPKLKVDFITLYQLKIKIVHNYLATIVNDFDILHIHGTEHQYEAMSYGFKIPKVISIQGIMNECKQYVPIKRYKQFLEWNLSAYYETKYLVKNNNYSCRTHWDSGYIKQHNPQANIYMIWEMIREEFFADNFSLKKENILFVGGKNEIKGLKELLFAYNNSLQSFGLNLIVLGNCTKNDIEELIAENNLSNIKLDNIDCRGMQDSIGMVKAYKDSYCLVHPTYIDNSPNSVCEAQLSGLPVIATNVGGLASLVFDEETGMLIDRKSSDIEVAVKKLFNNDVLRNSISINSRKIARQRHNPNKILKQTIDMYTTIIGEN